MIDIIKRKVYQKLKGAELNITDNGNYEENFPWLMLRLSNASSIKYADTRVSIVDFAIDIFSKYAGEQEILSLESKISPLLEQLPEEEDRICGVLLKNFKILDDKATGPVKKHGVLVYRFMLDTTLDQDKEEEEAPDDGE